MRNEKPSENFTIRVSMLPSYSDCPRRAAAKAWPKFFQAAGFSFRQLDNSIGAIIGTGVHAGAGYILEAKRDGKSASLTDAQEVSIVSLRKGAEAGIIWDGTTENLNTAEKQALRLTAQFDAELAPIVQPEYIEYRRKTIIKDGWELSGQPDVETVDEVIRDWKTGTALRAYQAQHGGYSLQRRSQGLSKPKRLIMDHLKRVSINTPQPPVHSVEYDVDVAERAAWAIIGYIGRDMRAFLKSGDPSSFPCNPMSMMCSDKYCPARGSSFCELVK